jgi:hypothetical protein
VESVFLTREQLEELTGYVTAAGQRRWLTREGIAFRIRRDGRPVVIIDELRSKPRERVAPPNFAALDTQD